jgi:Glycosyl hydrolase family 9./N-terminal ig-like domain of cellulase.
MRHCFLALLLATTSLFAAPPLPIGPAATVRVNSIGFLPNAIKHATALESVTEFRVLRIEGDNTREVYRGTAGQPMRAIASDTQERLRTLDFSSITEPGRYVIETRDAQRSAEFSIGNDVWNSPFEVVTHAMYLWRCGTEVRGEWQGIHYHQEPCHLEDGWLDHVGGGPHQHRSVGGWHDAGDYNKYVVNAGVSVGLMLKAFEHFPERIHGVNTNIPESTNNTPDILDEVRWELEWLFTMQLADGRVYHKLSALDFSYWGPPANDQSKRYFAPWGTAATAHFTAMMANAARVFRPFDAEFADRCLEAAKKSWDCLQRHPKPVIPDQSRFKTGSYEARDDSPRLWAAAEMWKATGDIAALREFERRARSLHFTENGPSWAEVQDLGFSVYLLSEYKNKTDDPRDPRLVKRLTNEVIERAQSAVKEARNNPHARPFGVARKRWFWGCNGNVAGQTFHLHLADRLNPDPSYRATALDALGHLFGRNYHGRSYVTGLGANPPQHPHDRRGEPAWPGYLVGGGWPDGRSWVDELASYERNEIAINWNAALIYALAAFVDPSASE